MVVSVTIPRAATDLHSIDNSLRELEQELAERYPVKLSRYSRLSYRSNIRCLKADCER